MGSERRLTLLLLCAVIGFMVQWHQRAPCTIAAGTEQNRVINGRRADFTQILRVAEASQVNETVTKPVGPGIDVLGFATKHAHTAPLRQESTMTTEQSKVHNRLFTLQSPSQSTLAVVAGNGIPDFEGEVVPATGYLAGAAPSNDANDFLHNYDIKACKGLKPYYGGSKGDRICMPGPPVPSQAPILDACRSIRKFMVISYGGSGSTTLTKALGSRAPASHLHDPQAPDNLVDDKPSWLRLDWERLVPPERVKDYQYVMIVRDPAEALLSFLRRFSVAGHCSYVVRNHTHCNLLTLKTPSTGHSNPSVAMLDEMAAQKHDFLHIRSFYNHWIHPVRPRNYRLAVINYHRLFDEEGLEAIVKGLCMPPSFRKRFPVRKPALNTTSGVNEGITLIGNKNVVVTPRTMAGIRALYGPLSRAIRALPPFHYV